VESFPIFSNCLSFGGPPGPRKNSPIFGPSLLKSNSNPEKKKKMNKNMKKNAPLPIRAKPPFSPFPNNGPSFDPALPAETPLPSGQTGASPKSPPKVPPRRGTQPRNPWRPPRPPGVFPPPQNLDGQPRPPLFGLGPFPHEKPEDRNTPPSSCRFPNRPYPSRKPADPKRPPLNERPHVPMGALVCPQIL